MISHCLQKAGSVFADRGKRFGLSLENITYFNMMAVLSEVRTPTDGIRHTQPNTSLYVKKNIVGSGTLYVTESVVTWIADSEKGLSLPYQNIILHAVSRDTNIFSRECLYMHTDAELPWPTDSDGESDDMNEDDCIITDAPRFTELYFAPEDKESLSCIYQALCDCQALNPDPMDDFSPDEDFYDEEDEDAQVFVADHQLSGLRITTNGNCTSNGHGDDIDMDPDCFEDAEEEHPDQ